MLVGIIHQENARISDMRVFQALHVLPKALKWLHNVHVEDTWIVLGFGVLAAL